MNQTRTVHGKLNKHQGTPRVTGRDSKLFARLQLKRSPRTTPAQSKKVRISLTHKRNQSQFPGPNGSPLHASPKPAAGDWTGKRGQRRPRPRAAESSVSDSLGGVAATRAWVGAWTSSIGGAGTAEYEHDGVGRGCFEVSADLGRAGKDVAKAQRLIPDLYT
jgi:hypothetical protein